MMGLRRGYITEFKLMHETSSLAVRSSKESKNLGVLIKPTSVQIVSLNLFIQRTIPRFKGRFYVHTSSKWILTADNKLGLRARNAEGESQSAIVVVQSVEVVSNQELNVFSWNKGQNEGLKRDS